jgi:tetratricopeptide (TPR) repeat protein
MAANQVADIADPVSNAVLTPQGSLFTRELLNRALANSAGASDRWKATAHALLANVLMNDYLNGWNHAGEEEDIVNNAQSAINQAMKLNPPPPVSALAHHAQGLVHRANGDQQPALEAFQKSVGFAPGFVRAKVQIANQSVLGGRDRDQARRDMEEVIDQNPHHPASGYFYWALGRAYFVDEKWSDAIAWLSRSVDALPTVPYNRAYLAAAQQHHGDTKAAKNTLQQSIDDPRLGRRTARAVAPPPETPNPHLVAARQKLREGLRDARANPKS